MTLRIALAVGAIVTTALTAAVTRAQDHPGPGQEVSADGKPCPTVTLHNAPHGDAGVKVIQIDTPQGRITLRHIVTPNMGHFLTTDCCDDYLEAMDWPAGMVPTPQQIEVGEGETGRIQFFCAALS